MIQISPQLSLALNMIVGVLAALSAATLQKMGIANPEQVAAWVGVLAIPLNIFLHMTSSADAGPIARRRDDGDRRNG